ncbi:Phosphatidylinositol 4-kinase beta [Porphyridium purpureum]|uniref:1-phosphatidylinositol 4-kinase n=1 Tax=Porphyridium purpureum TaxID=35688 RepID=A0A5J4YM65_PORPP|nr:Phosphatidylinositol 4-kinase beta [Porphyridium purpureum]|eukprot:POR2661..scf244_11
MIPPFQACFPKDRTQEEEGITLDVQSSDEENDGARDFSGDAGSKGAEFYPMTQGAALGLPETKARIRKVLEDTPAEKMQPDQVSLADLIAHTLGRLLADTDVVPWVEEAVAREPAIRRFVLPFVVNTLLYGFSDSASANGMKQSSSTSQNLGDTANSGVNATQNYAKRSQLVEKLENWLYSECFRSVQFALWASWYLSSSLVLGPATSHHHTMKLLLGVEAVVMNNKEAGALFGKATVVASAPGNERGTVAAAPDSVAAGGGNLSKRHSARHNAPSDIVGIAELEIAETTDGKIVKHRDVLNLDTVGDGLTNVKLDLGRLDKDQEEGIIQWIDQRRERRTVFHAEIDFVKCLTDISFELFNLEKAQRNQALRAELTELNKHIPVSAFMPTHHAPHRVLRCVPEECFTFSTKERVPFMLVLEISEQLPTSTTEKDAPEPASRKTHRRTKSKLGKSVSAANVGGGLVEGNSSVMVLRPNQSEDAFDHKTSLLLQHNSAQPSAEIDSSARPTSAAVGTDTATSDAPADNVDPVAAAEGEESVIESFGEAWSDKVERIRRSSPFKDDPNWRLISVIVKARDQLRQEMFAARLLRFFQRIFQQQKVPVWMNAYDIMATSSDSGFIEGLVDSKSIDSIKKSTPNFTTLRDYFKRKYGKNSAAYKRAVKNFVESMAAYSVICYVLAIKDRHNGNIMMDSRGHIMHIDFGFLLSNSPGGNREFERAPFKLTLEMVDLMGGKKSGYFRLFRKLSCKAYAAVCKYRTTLMLLVDLVMQGNEAMPCFVRGRDYVMRRLSQRLSPGMSTAERKRVFNRLIDKSANNFTTKVYDQFQSTVQGIHA